MPQVNENDGQTEWVELQYVSSPTILSRSKPQELLVLYWSQKDAPGENIHDNDILSEVSNYGSTG